MARLNWTTTKHFQWRDLMLPVADDLAPVENVEAGYFQASGIRPTGFGLTKRLGWPASELVRHAIGTGFIERTVGTLVRKYVTPTTDFLEFGPGPMNVRKYLPPDVWYNAIDIAFSEFQLRRVVTPASKINLAMASIKRVPLPDDSASMIVSVEVLYCIPQVDEVFAEVRRVLRDGGVLICSIANATYHKYKTIGQHPDQQNFWTFESFQEHLARFGFEPLDAVKRGYWLPVAKRGRLSNLYLPIEPKDEYHTSNFIYAFRLKK